MKIIEYTIEWKEKWDKFVLSSNNGTMFHTQKFFDYHTPGKFYFNHLIFIQGEEIIALLPGRIKDSTFESPVGASYGSFVTKDIPFITALKIVDTLTEYAKRNNIKEIILTAAPIIYEINPNQSMDFALLWRNYKYDLHYISSAVRLDPNEDIITRFQSTTRRNVRKSLKTEGIRVEINKRYDEFYPILIENKAKHNVKPTHSLEDLLKLEELLPENLILFMVYYNDIPIGGSSVFIANKNVTLCFYNMLCYEYEHLKPIQRINYEVIKWSTEHGYKYMDIGVSQDTKAENPMTPSINLIEFKEKFDAKTFTRNTFKLVLDN